jgi:hypothetical protein
VCGSSSVDSPVAHDPLVVITVFTVSKMMYRAMARDMIVT